MKILSILYIFLCYFPHFYYIFKNRKETEKFFTKLKAAFLAAKKLHGLAAIQPDASKPSDKPISPSSTAAPGEVISAAPEAISTKPRRQLLGSLLNKGAQLFAEVKNLLPATRLLPVTTLFAAAVNGERPPALNVRAEFFEIFCLGNNLIFGLFVFFFWIFIFYYKFIVKNNNKSKKIEFFYIDRYFSIFS